MYLLKKDQDFYPIKGQPGLWYKVNMTRKPCRYRVNAIMYIVLNVKKILSTERSKSRILKKFCSSIYLKANRKLNFSKQNMEFFIKSTLKLQKYDVKVHNFFRFRVISNISSVGLYSFHINISILPISVSHVATRKCILQYSGGTKQISAVKFLWYM